MWVYMKTTVVVQWGICMQSGRHTSLGAYANKTAFQLHVHPNDQYNNKKLKMHNKTRLKQYLSLANPESVCTLNSAPDITAIWQPSCNSQWSSLVGNLKFLCSYM